MGYVKYFTKRMLFSLVYAFTIIMLSMAIMIIKEELLWLKYILYALTLGLYSFVLIAMSYGEGREAVKIRHNNDIERLNIIRTGADIKLNVVKEYKPWKGFAIGISCCAPLILLMIIQSIFFLANPNDPQLWAGAIASYMYIVVFAFFRPNNVYYATLAEALNYYYLLVAIPVFMLIWGVPYLVGAKRQMRDYAKIEQKHKQIYGENN